LTVAWLERLWSFIEAGGPIMAPLTVISFWMWVLIILKSAWLLKVKRHRLGLARAIECLAGDRDPTADTWGPRSAALSFFMAHQRFHAQADHLMWEASIRRQLPGLSRHLTTVIVLASVAPLLGLLGTVTGMVETFRAICLHGTGNAQALASGIKEALITTQAGLLVAIPGLFAGQTLRKRIRNLHQDLMAFHRAVDRWLERSREYA
jgi:biopolymer transport protein ExbB